MKIIFCIVFFQLLFIDYSFSQTNVWTRTNDLQNEYISGLVINSDGHIFAGSFSPGKIFRSLDNGNSWTHLINLPNIWSLAINDSQHIFAATLGGEGIYRSKDNGDTWPAANSGLHNNTCNNLAFSDSGYAFAATDYGMYRSSDNGNNWAPADSGLPADMMYDVCVAPNGYVYAGTYDNGIYRSIDNGFTWQEKNNGLTYLGIWSLLCSKNGFLFSGPDGGYIERSVDYGENWQLLTNGFPNTAFYQVLTINSEGSVFVGHEQSGYGVYRSDDNGDTWTGFSIGFAPGIGIGSLFVNNEDILFSGTSNGVYRTIQTTTSLKEIPTKILDDFILEQNYPNPFNPWTAIKFSIPFTERISLDIYNIQGQKVATLFNDELKAGDYEVEFDASKLSSGIYYYILNAGEFKQTKKMLLLK